MSDRGVWRRLRHAFGVEDPDDFEPTVEEREIAVRICREVVRRRMVTPALMLLEMSRPLNYLGAQALHFFRPFASVLVDGRSWESFAAFVERRGSVEFLCRTLEDAAAEEADDDRNADDADDAGPVTDSDDLESADAVE